MTTTTEETSQSTEVKPEYTKTDNNTNVAAAADDEKTESVSKSSPTKSEKAPQAMTLKMIDFLLGSWAGAGEDTMPPMPANPYWGTVLFSAIPPTSNNMGPNTPTEELFGVQYHIKDYMTEAKKTQKHDECGYILFASEAMPDADAGEERFSVPMKVISVVRGVSMLATGNFSFTYSANGDEVDRVAINLSATSGSPTNGICNSPWFLETKLKTTAFTWTGTLDFKAGTYGYVEDATLLVSGQKLQHKDVSTMHKVLPPVIT